MKPRIFLGSSAQQEKLLQALTRGLQDVADVEPWTSVFNPGVSTLERLVELTHQVDFAAFIFAQDDWTSKGATPDAGAAQASPRDNVVFEAGLFGGALGIRRTFVLHAHGAKLPSDLNGLTAIRYDPDTTPQIVRQINQKLRKAIDAEGRISRIEGDWWQLALTARVADSSAVSMLTVWRDRFGTLEIAGRSWDADGTLTTRYHSEATREHIDPAGVFYFWRGERPRDPNAPEYEGTAEIKLESVDRASGYYIITRSGDPDHVHVKTSGIYVRADPGDKVVLEGSDPAQRAELIQRRIGEWRDLANF
jgi:Predicted nucleotide-binding protein containing TIR-like domain